METEKILKIEETTFATNENANCYYDGYQIITDKQTIQIGIESEKWCCEEFGHLITNDEIKDFIGAKLLGISITDTVLNNKKIEEIEFLLNGGVMFVNLETSEGVLQFVAYNYHNGCYGHNAVLVSKQLNHKKML